MLAPGLAVWAKFVTVPDDASVVEVVGQQWTWSYRFPGRDGELGETDMQARDARQSVRHRSRRIRSRAGRRARRLPELHLPLGKPVKMLLRAKDVNHQFAVPQFRVKMDMVPGMVTYFWFTPTRTGAFDALCEQLCGVAHFAMRGRVVVDEEAAFQEWLATQPTYAQTAARSKAMPRPARRCSRPAPHVTARKAEGNRELDAPKLGGQAAGTSRGSCRASSRACAARTRTTPTASR